MVKHEPPFVKARLGFKLFFCITMEEKGKKIPRSKRYEGSMVPYTARKNFTKNSREMP